MVVEYVASIKTAWELAKVVKTSTDAIDDAQIKLQVAELIGALADAKIQASENAELIAQLEKQIKVKSEMKFNGSVYYKLSEDDSEEGPWCPTCFDARNTEIRLQKDTSASSRNWRCIECTHLYM